MIHVPWAEETTSRDILDCRRSLAASLEAPASLLLKIEASMSSFVAPSDWLRRPDGPWTKKQLDFHSIIDDALTHKRARINSIKNITG